MRFTHTIMALMLMPGLALAQSAAPTANAAPTAAAGQAAGSPGPARRGGDGSGADRPEASAAAKSSTPTTSPSVAAPAEFLTFQPTPFETRLFHDPEKITQVDGPDIYKALCAGCHMPDAKGAVGAGFYPALAGNENLAVGDYPVSVIMNGLHGMPPFRQLLDDAQIVAVVTYLQTTLKDADITPPTVEMVAAARDVAEPLPE